MQKLYLLQNSIIVVKASRKLKFPEVEIGAWWKLPPKVSSDECANAKALITE